VLLAVAGALLRRRDRRYRPPSEPLLVWTPPERQAFAGLREAAAPFQDAPPREAEPRPVVDPDAGPELRPDTPPATTQPTSAPRDRSTTPRIGALLPYLAAVTGRPEPATEPQVAAIERMGLAGDAAALSVGQADAILCAGAYAAAVLRALGPEGVERSEAARLEAALAAFVVRDEALRRHALAWCGQNLARGDWRRRAPPRDEHLARVELAARVLLGSPDRGASVLPLAPTALVST
jgi:hypothetical protein